MVMNGDQIRDSFIQYFESKGHQHMPSASLIPAGDPTLLFTSAGMVPFKPFFMGEQTPPSRRLTSSQKSFRTTDIDEVGDHKHLTFFEMLGNFSIGDYFKEGAVDFAWELVTQLFGLSPDRLYVTIHLDDDEAYGIWNEQVGVPPERIYRYGDKDNWWGPAGTEGPTGPCSEIHYDGGVEKGCSGGRMVEVDVLTAQLREERDGAAPGEVDGCHPNCDCERFVELWNLVFMQYYQDTDRNRTPLPAPSVDTGMGLERAAVILQGKNNIYETDLFTPIIDKACQLTGRGYGADTETDFALRVIAEHARAAAFLIGDGVVPGNEGRGYVLRRVIRRAIRYGRRLGLTGPFLVEVVKEVIPRFQGVYGELSLNRDFILRVINLEEERFAEAFGRGNEILLDMIGTQSASGAARGMISGRDTFLLYDTYGFPPELTAEIAREHDFDVDLEGFEAEMERQREQSRAGQQFEGNMEMLTAYENLGAGRTEFTGHTLIHQESVVAALLVDGASSGHATQGQRAEVVLSRTSFYAEGGGQLGDQGFIRGPNGLFRVEDTQSPVAGLIVQRGVVEEGHIAVGDPAQAGVDVARRLDSSRNHSGTHILHAALRATLGPHVRQAGSLVAPERLRFDFSHVGRMSREELLAVQSLANEKVRANLLVSAQETSYADAVRQGALAFFGDRYGDVVRVVRMAEDSTDPFSFEVCGGTHVAATGQVGTLLVLGESSIGGGHAPRRGVDGSGRRGTVRGTVGHPGCTVAAAPNARVRTGISPGQLHAGDRRPAATPRCDGTVPAPLGGRGSAAAGGRYRRRAHRGGAYLCPQRRRHAGDGRLPARQALELRRDAGRPLGRQSDTRRDGHCRPGGARPQRRQHRPRRRQADGRRRRRSSRNGPGGRPPAGEAGRGPGLCSRPGPRRAVVGGSCGLRLPSQTGA